MSVTDRPLQKAPTGIRGFDALVHGGLPAGRPTLLAGTTGSGKTVFAAEFLARGVLDFDEPGVFVTFEESPADLRVNMASLGFDVVSFEAAGRWAFVDASPHADGEEVVGGTTSSPWSPGSTTPSPHWGRPAWPSTRWGRCSPASRSLPSSAASWPG